MLVIITILMTRLTENLDNAEKTVAGADLRSTSQE